MLLELSCPSYDNKYILCSKPGRPPTKKGAVGDRKGLTRLKRPGMNVGGEISGIIKIVELFFY